MAVDVFLQFLFQLHALFCLLAFAKSSHPLREVLSMVIGPCVILSDKL